MNDINRQNKVSTIAGVDRRVELRGQESKDRSIFCNVSDLRKKPFVVLLGEPGIGKSTVFRSEAERQGAALLKVRQLVNGARPEMGGTLFIDSLDEYRSDGQAADKACTLAMAIKDAKVRRWRLSCRSEDWRNEADINEIRSTVGGEDIVVAQLLPLDRREAGEILIAYGEQDPDMFLTKADSFGATAFTQNPLSLKLLHKAVMESGAWPITRFQLFGAAVAQLAHEHSPDYEYTRRSSPDTILDAASRTCLLLLATGAPAIWRSNAPPPDGAGNRKHLTRHHLGLNSDLFADVLDTSLFRGDANAFEPMHKTVAEFLAGQALAKAVIGDKDRAALPLARAVAFITGFDGSPPTELRGLYAWFAAHLAQHGDVAGARRLIERDAATVLAYGDASAFDTEGRREMLENLDRDDPFFRSSERGNTAFGGLAGEDLAEEFQAILTTPPNSQRFLTVLDALRTGTPVASIRPFLRAMTLDPSRPDWHRWRAADAWLNGESDGNAARRSLLEELAFENPSADREALRLHLAAELPIESVGVDEIRSLVADFERSPDDNVIMRLYALQKNLETEPKPELFDEPVDAWRPPRGERKRRTEVDRFLDSVLAAAIRAQSDLNGAQLWRWLKHVFGASHQSLDEKTWTALDEWLQDQPEHEIRLFDAILAEDTPDRRPWEVGGAYYHVTHRRASGAVCHHVLELSRLAATKASSRRLLEIAIHLADHPTADPDAYWSVYDRIVASPRSKGLLATLTIIRLSKYQLAERRRIIERNRKKEMSRSRDIEILSLRVADLQAGRDIQNLEFAASHYFGLAGGDRATPSFEQVISTTNEIIATAVKEGWEQLVLANPSNANAAQLGNLEGTGKSFYFEMPTIAGLDLLINESRPPDLGTTPIVVAIIVLKSASFVENEKRRGLLEDWAVDRLNLSPDAGAQELLAYWNAALDTKREHLDGLRTLSQADRDPSAVIVAVETILASRPAMPAPALKAAFEFALKFIDRGRVLELANAGFGTAGMPVQQRSIYALILFMLAPTEAIDIFLRRHRTETEDLLSGDLAGQVIAIDDHLAVERVARLLKLGGRWGVPSDQSGRGRHRRDLSDSIRGFIGQLAESTHPGARDELAALCTDMDLSAWQPQLMHARAQQARLCRDKDFRHPLVTVIVEAIAGGPPVNASDLRAVVLEELGRLREELHRGDDTPWKRYWVLKGSKAVLPLEENQCRDNLMSRLRDRMQRYGIKLLLPEARRGEETRADMLILSGAGRNLPIEAKRHFHPDIWIAATTQLQGYVADPNADGFGIYLVFWFGNDAHPTPSRPDGKVGPMTAGELEELLCADLPAYLRWRTDIVVFDVSRPDAKPAKPRKRRSHRLPDLADSERLSLGGSDRIRNRS